MDQDGAFFMATVINELLKRVPLFSSLPRRDILFLRQISKIVDMAENTVLFTEGEVGDRLYVIVRGELEIIKAFGTRDEIILRVCSVGEHIGEMSFLSPGGIRSATVRAKTRVRLLEIGRDDFEALLSHRPELASALARCLSQRLVDAEKRFTRALGEKGRKPTEDPESPKRNHLVPDRSLAQKEPGRSALKIFTLGRFEIEIGGVSLQFSGKVPRRPLQMLKLLISHGGGAVSEELIVDCLWPEADGAAAHNAFTTTLFRLRRILGVEGAIILQEGKVSIDSRCCWVDAHVFQRILIELDKGEGEEESTCFEKHTRCAQFFAEALAIYKGHFLPADEREFWVISYRERLRAQFCGLVIRAAGRLEETGQWEKAAGCYQKGLAIDDTTEDFYQRLMICQSKLGLDANAVELYRRCRKLLAVKLGIEPSARTEAIYRGIKDLNDRPL
jgi:CRP-like cAMP-binding protein/DNA-binding SARP family transcriptional activator